MPFTCLRSECFPGSSDLVVDDNDIVYFAQSNEAAVHWSITRLEDVDDDGNANDSGEAKVYAVFWLSHQGVPTGLAAKLPMPQPLEMIPFFVDFSPKGPWLVVEEGATAPLGIRVMDRATGTPVAGVKVGSQVLYGCFALCPRVERTDADGRIIFDVTRTGLLHMEKH